MQIRQPHVAGTFYPSDPSEIEKFCRPHLVSSESKVKARAVILPHAGYIYSGALACKVLSRIEIPLKILLIGPNHRGYGSDFAVFTKGQWETPLGRVPVDEEIAAALLESSRDFQKDEEAHAFEHSLEVEVPLLQSLSASFKIIPLIVGTLNLEALRRAALQMGEALAGCLQSLLVAVSNDMSHYEADAVTRVKDRYALDAILNLDAEGLARAVKKYQITMCGFAPVYMMLVMKESLGIQKAELVGYSTSGDVTGDRERVVGYAGFIFE